MKNAKIVRVAEWDGWCGACAAERPLVLTRVGRQRLRTWLTGAADDSRPLVLTCRLCGTGVDVPLERDDPPPVQVAYAREELLDAPAVEQAVSLQAVSQQPPVAMPAQPALPAQATGSELTAGHQAVAQALRTLLAQRTAAAVVPIQASTTVPVLPLQRTATTGGLAELQLLADGIDLLSSGRA